MITFIWHTSNDALPHDLTGRRRFSRHVRTHLTVHNNKLKLLGNGGLLLGDKYFNIEEKMRQYFSCLFHRLSFCLSHPNALPCGQPGILQHRFRCFFGADDCNVRKVMMREL